MSRTHAAILAAFSLFTAPTFAWADQADAPHDIGQDEIIVTGSRREADGYDATQPAVGLRRHADFAIQQVTVTGDTRDPAQRHQEMFETIRAAIAAAGRSGVQLATGETVVEPLTLENYRNLSLHADNRPDAERVSFLVKVPLTDTSDVAAITARITAFVHAVPVSGRALVATTDDLTLSVVRPDQYRGQIVDLVAADARAMAARFGSDYAVEARGVERPVEWSRAGLTDVLLYIPYQITVVPRR